MSNTYQKDRRRAQPDWSPVDRQAAGGQPGAAEEILVCAAKAAMGLRDLAALTAEIYERSRPGPPVQATAAGTQRWVAAALPTSLSRPSAGSTR